MPPHIGKLVQKTVEQKRLTHKEFGALIHRNEKTIPDIYDRESMSTDLLLSISEALKEDFIKPYYEEEPLKSLRNDEVFKLQAELNNQIVLLNGLKEKQELIKLELSLNKDLSEARKESISFVKELKDLYKQLYSEAISKAVLNAEVPLNTIKEDPSQSANNIPKSVP